MAQIDSYLKCLVSENELNYLDDLLNLYDFIPNEALKTLLEVYHTQLNHWFAALNHHINDTAKARHFVVPLRYWLYQRQPPAMPGVKK